MKFLKWVFVLLGIAALITGGVILMNAVWDQGKLMAAVRGYNTGVQDPTHRFYYSIGLAALGGLLLGWGIGLPSRTGRGIRSAYKRDLEAQGYHRDEVAEEHHNGLLHRDRVARDEVVDNREERI